MAYSSRFLLLTSGLFYASITHRSLKLSKLTRQNAFGDFPRGGFFMGGKVL